MPYEIPLLKAEDIQVKVKSIKQDFKDKSKYSGFFLLYKNARVDMDILDKVFGPDGWQRHHKEAKGNLFCTVSVRYGDIWVDKEDVGVESFSEAEKGEASDSFKRACVNVGIGRELYSSPKINVDLNKGELSEDHKKCYLSLHVKDITYNPETRKIVGLVLVDKHEKQRFAYGVPSDNYPPNPTTPGIKDKKEPKPVLEMDDEIPFKKEKAEQPHTVFSKCSKCGEDITPAVSDYSLIHFGKALCFKCQKTAKKPGTDLWPAK